LLIFFNVPFLKIRFKSTKPFLILFIKWFANSSDEIFLAIEMKIIDKDDLISTLENRFISGDVILTGTDIPKDLLLMANQITELRS